MRKHLALALLAVVLAAGCATQKPRPEAPTLAEIVEMSRNKVPSDQIIQRIRDSRAVYDLSGSEYARLHGQGVPDAVLNHMQQTQIEAARDNGYRRSPSVFGNIWGGSHGSGVGIGVGF